MFFCKFETESFMNFLEPKVAVEVLVKESNNVAAAIAEEVSWNSVERLVIGSSSRSFFSR